MNEENDNGGQIPVILVKFRNFAWPIKSCNIALLLFLLIVIRDRAEQTIKACPET